MGLALETTLRSRERILAFGPQGAGKSTAAGHIARKMTDKMWVIDCDNAWDRALDTEFSDIDDGRLELLHVRDWEQFVDAMQKVFAQAERDDWIVIDDMSYPWAWILRWYIKKTHGAEMPEFMIDHRIRQIGNESKATGGQDAVLVEWNYLNPVWNDEVADPMVNTPCHLFVCCAAKKLRTDSQGARKEVRDLYEQVGYNPASQWRLGHQMQTVIFMERAVVSGYKMTTVKDRGRNEMEEVPWGDFAMDYLMKEAKWKPAKK